jgi:hypothetical protein
MLVKRRLDSSSTADFSARKVVMSNDKRHQGDTKTFEELTFSEQAKAINIKVVWFLDATRSHIRKCVSEHGAGRAQGIPHKVAQQLRSMADQLDAIETPTVAGMI